MSEGVAQLKHEVRARVCIVARVTSTSFVIAPLDVIKIRLQLQIHSLSDPLSVQGIHGPVYKGTLGTLKQILAHEGVTGLWKGNIPAELMYLAYGSIQFSAYTYASSLLEHPALPIHLPSSAVNFLSGAAAGAAATTATYPLDLLRTRFAAQGNERVYTSIRASVQQIASQEGLGGFFRGLGAGVSQIVPYMGLFFASYESLKPLMSESPIPLPFGTSDAAAGVVASILSKTAVYPLDTTRKRLQVQGPMLARYVHGNIPEYRGVISTVRRIWRQEGRRGMYRGLTVSLIKAAPASAVTMWTYERAMAAMLAWEDARS
ncbi:mitochondrial thiamine pyrophosphate transporter [Didymella pomorum]|uniref:Mitochondrial thiamine pyrophosphate carrier 1 n=1 Tax=Didymella pomorum TaxID=749634 RepID=A0A9W8ZKA3_9PLEO|nr:mitochondrial thiamine pyrophosphate transporter [Didymella pomorum]